MCSLKDTPWRKDFTGFPCRCGVPTPGTEAERIIDRLEMKKKEKAEAEEKISEVERIIDRIEMKKKEKAEAEEKISVTELKKQFPSLVFPESSAQINARVAIADERERRINELFRKYGH